VSTRSAMAVVERKYNPSPGACTQALEMLLAHPANKKADEPAPEPIGRDDVRESNGYAASSNCNK
jgi:hypothetical protein